MLSAFSRSVALRAEMMRLRRPRSTKHTVNRTSPASRSGACDLRRAHRGRVDRCRGDRRRPIAPARTRRRACGGCVPPCHRPTQSHRPACSTGMPYSEPLQGKTTGPASIALGVRVGVTACNHPRFGPQSSLIPAQIGLEPTFASPEAISVASAHGPAKKLELSMPGFCDETEGAMQYRFWMGGIGRRIVR